MKTETRENTIFKIHYDAVSQDVMIKEIQKNPATDELFHVDLVQIQMDRASRIAVPLQLMGEAVGVKTEGGSSISSQRSTSNACRAASPSLSRSRSRHHLHQSLKVSTSSRPRASSSWKSGTVIVLIQVPHAEEVEAKPAERRRRGDQGARGHRRSGRRKKKEK
jgi:large subunit ribosomal protein L25